jgi:hypothetical protein
MFDFGIILDPWQVQGYWLIVLEGGLARHDGERLLYVTLGARRRED